MIYRRTSSVAAADVPDDVSRTKISPGGLPDTWRQTPAPAELAAIGDRFARRNREAVLAGAVRPVARRIQLAAESRPS